MIIHIIAVYATVVVVVTVIIVNITLADIPSLSPPQELRQMEQMGTAAENGRHNQLFSKQESHQADQSHLKTEVTLMQHKYERLLQKERRMMVGGEVVVLLVVMLRAFT